MKILNLSSAPGDPIERIMWLDGVMEAVKKELEDQYRDAYFDARMQGRINDAVNAGKASRKQAIVWTRQKNQATGRAVRWGDDADPWSSRR